MLPLEERAEILWCSKTGHELDLLLAPKGREIYGSHFTGCYLVLSLLKDSLHIAGTFVCM